ncbi:hypothetical protein [Streptomyces chiangmaiensis]|uniref:Uncharacterized protein n=1 Tax=Streptomyces chiangmaiensis TaxID=766497 RepID=A0ABU7FLJ0_9ACTN|nr:hypothetical protein [Streptomyces chiangmaiensis]MED7824967.1 hypothetical protein [Streptomyces chiangmaiensis]
MNALRRLPWQDNGKPAYVTPGDGIVNALADTMENMTLAQAEDLADQAARMARDSKANARDMRPVLALLAGAVNVARLRGERLGEDSDEERAQRDADR